MSDHAPVRLHDQGQETAFCIRRDGIGVHEQFSPAVEPAAMTWLTCPANGVRRPVFLAAVSVAAWRGFPLDSALVHLEFKPLKSHSYL